MTTKTIKPTDPRFQDITGKRFGKLVVLEYTHTDSRRMAYWLCQCDCGNIKIIMGRSMKRGASATCGCGRKTGAATRLIHGHKRAGHSTSEYQTWISMTQRCTNKNAPSYSYYGGRGITVCDRWRHSYQNFFDDMGNKPSRLHTIDRINGGGNYEKSNCRWADKKQQSHNRKNVIPVMFQGETLVLTEWAVKLGISHETLRRKIRKGLSAEEAFAPVRKSSR